MQEVVAVRKAQKADIPAITAALAAAFDDDPVMAWLFPQTDGSRQARIRGFFDLSIRYITLRHDAVYTTPTYAGAAMWAPPGKWHVSTLDVIRCLPPTMRTIGPRRLPTALRGLGVIDKHHPREPHWYLSALGTEPAHQGKGIGSALMAPVLERCDRELIGAYLESSKASNVLFYRRHGFEVTSEIRLPDGPTIWGMWRDPAP